MPAKSAEDPWKICCKFTCESHAIDADLFSARVHFMLDTNICLTYIHSMKRISMFLSDRQIAALKKLAKRTGIKMSELVRRFIDEGLKRV
jgi:hypothetical protein